MKLRNNEKYEQDQKRKESLLSLHDNNSQLVCLPSYIHGTNGGPAQIKPIREVDEKRGKRGIEHIIIKERKEGKVV